MTQTLRSGSSSITVDQDALIRHLDRLADGAASRFIDRVRPPMETQVETARPVWPRRTGQSAGTLAVETDVTTKAVAVTASAGPDRAAGQYSYKLRFSKYTSAELDEEARKYSLRAKTPEKAEKARAHWARMLFRIHGHGAPSEALAGKHAWSVLVRAPLMRQRERIVIEAQADLERLARG